MADQAERGHRPGGRRRWLLAAGWTALILLACLWPRRQMPVDESRIGFHVVPHLDKVIHFSLFAVHSILWRRAVPGGATLVGGLLLALVSEAGQELPVVGRDADRFDLLADSLGVISGLGIVHWRRARREETPRPPGRPPND